MCDTEQERDKPENDEGVTQMEVTPEMIAAGVDELRERYIGEPLTTIVEVVFWAMWSARPSDQSDPKRLA